MIDDAQLTRVAHWLHEASSVMVLTGAGVSTASGLPDFRSTAGLWSQRDPMVEGHINTFHRDPARVWEFYVDRFDGSVGAEPNAAHQAIRSLETSGLVDTLVTQNVDGLHEATGSTPLCVHGTLAQASCRNCGYTMAMVAARELRDRAERRYPACPDCGSPLGPAIILFGEPLPPAASEAFAIADRADLIICAGTSLNVYPVAELPLRILHDGGRVVTMNREPTALHAKLQRQAPARFLHVEGSLEEVLPRVAAFAARP